MSSKQDVFISWLFYSNIFTTDLEHVGMEISPSKIIILLNNKTNTFIQEKTIISNMKSELRRVVWLVKVWWNYVGKWTIVNCQCNGNRHWELHQLHPADTGWHDVGRP